jgi:replicative DNA helicase
MVINTIKVKNIMEIINNILLKNRIIILIFYIELTKETIKYNILINKAIS